MYEVYCTFEIQDPPSGWLIQGTSPQLLRAAKRSIGGPPLLFDYGETGTWGYFNRFAMQRLMMEIETRSARLITDTYKATSAASAASCPAQASFKVNTADNNHGTHRDLLVIISAPRNFQ